MGLGLKRRAGFGAVLMAALVGCPAEAPPLNKPPRPAPSLGTAAVPTATPAATPSGIATLPPGVSPAPATPTPSPATSPGQGDPSPSPSTSTSPTPSVSPSSGSSGGGGSSPTPSPAPAFALVPNFGSPGQIIAITGSGFSTTAIQNVVTFADGAAAEVRTATATELTIVVPLSASGLVTVAVNGVSRGTAAFNFPVENWAGDGTSGFMDGTTGVTSRFASPRGVAVDASGNVYVADSGNQLIRKIAAGAARSVSTIAGDGQAGFVDATGIAARFSGPAGLALDAARSKLYVADVNNHRIRAVNLGTFAVTALAGDGGAGLVNANGVGARFSLPSALALSADGTTLFVADKGNHVVRAIDLAGGSDAVTTVCGDGTNGFADGAGVIAKFKSPSGLALLPDGLLVIADAADARLRLVDPKDANHIVSTVAGSGTAGLSDGAGPAATFDQPGGLAVDTAGKVFVADVGNHRIRSVDVPDPNRITATVTGSASGYADGSLTEAKFNGPTAIARGADGALYVVDTGNHRIRRVKP